MNERIRELADQAGLEYDFHPMLWLKYDKFAELIVRECVIICDEIQRQYGQYTFTATKVKEEIQERFGVEE